MNGNNNRPFTELLGDLLQQLTMLFRKEIQLARAETTEKVEQAAVAGGYLIGAAIFMGAALLFLLDFVVHGLVELGIQTHWATLIVALGAALVGYILLRKGAHDLKNTNMKPEKTADQVHRDVVAVKEHVR